MVNLRPLRRGRPHGFYYAPDPSSQKACTIGGNVANNSGGPHTLNYGVTTNHVLGLEVVSARRRARLGRRRRATRGLRPVGLLVGSEGTFGIVTKIGVRLTQPETVQDRPGASSARSSDARRPCRRIIARGHRPRRDRDDGPADDPGGRGRVRAAAIRRDAAAVLLIEVDGLRGRMDAQAERDHQACRDTGARERAGRARTRPSAQLLWKGRKAAFGAIGRISPDLHGHGRRGPAHQAAVRPATRRRDRAAHGLRDRATSFTPATATCIRTSCSIHAMPGRRAWSPPAARS